MGVDGKGSPLGEGGQAGSDAGWRRGQESTIGLPRIYDPRVAGEKVLAAGPPQRDQTGRVGLLRLS